MAVPVPTLWTTIEGRIRKDIVEDVATFWTSAELGDWFQKGHHLFHRAVLENAMRTGKLDLYEHDYLRGYVDRDLINITAGTRDYALSLLTAITRRIIEIVRVEVSLPATPHPILAKRVPWHHDWRLRTYPRQWGPGPDEAFWALSPGAGEATSIRLYVPTDNLTPAQAVTDGLRVDAIVEPDPVVLLGDADIEDRFCVGPEYYAVGMARQKQGMDPAPYLQKFQAAIETEMPPAREATA